jgi:hypothetical protein
MKNLVKTLVIHPDDRSTDFLKEIYRDKPDWTIVNDHETCQSRKKIMKLIRSNDRIIMLGHGGSMGLFYTCINPIMVDTLRGKELIFVWCNADRFVERYGLKGFSTQMFCSEYSECYNEGIKNIEKGMVEESNEAFATIMSKHIDENLNVIHEKVTQEYGIIANINPVASYNNKRLLLIL